MRWTYPTRVNHFLWRFQKKKKSNWWKELHSFFYIYFLYVCETILFQGGREGGETGREGDRLRWMTLHKWGWNKKKILHLSLRTFHEENGGNIQGLGDAEIHPCLGKSQLKPHTCWATATGREGRVPSTHRHILQNTLGLWFFCYFVTLQGHILQRHDDGHTGQVRCILTIF